MSALTYRVYKPSSARLCVNQKADHALILEEVLPESVDELKVVNADKHKFL